MKKSTIILIAGAILTICACTKKSTKISNLNATEKQLIGTWYLQKEVDSMLLYGIDSVYTGYGTNAYITFTYIEFGTPEGGAAINWKAYSGSWLPSTGTPSYAIGTVIASYWYYDNTTDYLSIKTNQCTIVSITSTQLVVRFSNSTHTIYSYFSK